MNDIVETDEEREAREREAEALLRARRCLTALGQAPELAHQIRSALTPSDGRTERGLWFPVMATPLLTAIADDADELYVRILDWVSYWNDTLEFGPAMHAIAARNFQGAHQSAEYADATVTGFKAGTTPTQAAMLTRVQTMWLITRAPYIDGHPAAAEYHDDVRSMIWNFRAKYHLTPARERNVQGAPCPVCGEVTVGAFWRSNDILDVSISCDYCGHVVPTPRASDIERWLGASAPVATISPACLAWDHQLCTLISEPCSCGCHYRALERPAGGES